FVASSPVVLQGPAVADYSGSMAFLDLTDNLSISGITIRNFYYGVFSTYSASGFSHGVLFSNSRLENNSFGLWSKYGNTNLTLVNNTVVVPAPADPDPSSSAIGLLVLGGYSIIAGNTVTGPGAVLHFHSASDLLKVDSTPQLTLKTSGIW